MKRLIRSIPVVGPMLTQLYWRLLAQRRPAQPFPGTTSYWEQRYSTGGDSGLGSYGKFAQFKAEVINRFVADSSVGSVIEFGCGDGHQLTLARYPSYLGFDVSPTVIASCHEKFRQDPSKQFRLMTDYQGESADLALSLDVIYHLIEDQVFDQYIRTLFGASRRYVIIYSSNTEDNHGYSGTHVKHRRFTEWVAAHLVDWKLMHKIPNRYPYNGGSREGSFADFYIYERRIRA